jgi:hypothetical protein
MCLKSERCLGLLGGFGDGLVRLPPWACFVYPPCWDGGKRVCEGMRRREESVRLFVLRCAHMGENKDAL